MVGLLRSMLGAPEPELVACAVRALGACRDADSEDDVARLAVHGDAAVRAAAIEALALLE
jgi:hypothetical protein